MRLLLNEWRKFLDEANLAPEWQEQMRLKDKYLDDEAAQAWVKSAVVDEKFAREIENMMVGDAAMYVSTLFQTLDEPLGGGRYVSDHDYAKDAKALDKEIADRNVEALRTRILAALGADKAKGDYMASLKTAGRHS